MAEFAVPPAMEGVISTSEPTTAAPPEEPEVTPCETLYIQNLNEKIKPEGTLSSIKTPSRIFTFYFRLIVMKATLKGLFKSYGEVLDVVAHSNLRMRGQAFVSFADAEIAKKAMKDVQRFPLYSKPMVSYLHFLFLPN